MAATGFLENEHRPIRAVLALATFLLLEGVLRPWISPDPWLLDADNTYFDQPRRFWMEVTFTAAALIALFAASGIRLFVHPISRAQREYLLYGVFGAVLFFAFWERSSIDAIINQGLLAATPIWLATGFMIGVGQEVTFRGLLYGGLRKYFGVAVAAALTTVVFVVAPIHSLRLIDYGQAGATDAVLILVPLYIAFGAVFMWLRIETGSVLVPALAHGVGNAITWAATFAIVASA